MWPGCRRPATTSSFNEADGQSRRRSSGTRRRATWLTRCFNEADDQGRRIYFARNSRRWIPDIASMRPTTNAAGNWSLAWTASASRSRFNEADGQRRRRSGWNPELASNGVLLQ